MMLDGGFWNFAPAVFSTTNNLRCIYASNDDRLTMLTT